MGSEMCIRDRDYIEHATKKNPVAVMGNGDVTGYVYIVKTHAL